MAIAIGMQACKRDYRVLYFKTSRLVNLLAQSKANKTENKFWKRLEKADVLILDEWDISLLKELARSCFLKLYLTVMKRGA